MAGVEVEASAEGLPPNKTVDLVWGTVNGGWVVEDYYRFRGKKFTNATQVLTNAKVGADGRVSVRFKVPEDYGGVHEVFVSENGVTLAQGGIDVGQTFEMHPTEGPVGTPIEIRVKGLGWRTMESTWVVNWDNHEVGWVSATDTRGSAVGTVPRRGHGWRASGQGLHRIHGPGLSESRTGAQLVSAQTRFRLSRHARSAPTRQAYAEPYQKQPLPRTPRRRVASRS